ncbi:MAG: SPFH domain-containing protein [Marinilabiliales bacterium]|nr:MAG: SPFH domain-containing protein [Marinilabiliales bacterium]
MEKEKKLPPYMGYPGAIIALALFIGPILLAVYVSPWWLFLLIADGFCWMGLLVVNPNQSAVLVLFGKYSGTIKKNGFYWINPFFDRKIISLRARNLNSEPIKVNDKLGNPVMIGIVLVWRVADTFKAAFEVDDFIRFVDIQSEAAIRKLAGFYPYDNFDDAEADISLRSGGEEVNNELENELKDRLKIAGIHVMEARIAYLAYASEIAGAMLRRQQASAVVAARQKIVEGAVSMVDLALARLSEKDIVSLDEEKKATMVSNLMVVLCSDKDVSPVINTGSLYQ